MSDEPKIEAVEQATIRDVRLEYPDRIAVQPSEFRLTRYGGSEAATHTISGSRPTNAKPVMVWKYEAELIFSPGEQPDVLGVVSPFTLDVLLVGGQPWFVAFPMDFETPQ